VGRGGVGRGGVGRGGVGRGKGGGERGRGRGSDVYYDFMHGLGTLLFYLVFPLCWRSWEGGVWAGACGEACRFGT